ncbi:MAG: glycosyltransferase [Candidatus Pacearchaeota archaeon]
MINISIVIPTINSEKFIQKTVNHIYNYLEKNKKKIGIKNYEIILVPQYSNDNTFDIIKKIVNKNKKVKAIFLYEKGKGNALNNGIKAAKNNFVLMIDDDLSYPISFLEDAVKYCNKYDIIIGSRYIKKPKLPLKRKIASIGYKILLRLFFNLKFKDTQSGLKLINKKVFKKIGYPKQKRYVWDTELLWKASKAKLKIYEVPIEYNFRENVLKLRKAIPQMFYDLLKLRISTLKK